MFRAFCDICDEEIKEPRVELAHLCPVCEPFGVEYFTEVQRIVLEEEDVKRRRVAKMKAAFYQTRIAPLRKLKAVK